MRGPHIIVRTLSRAAVPDKFGNVWQYHSRSDRHSKVACWGMLFDLLRHSKVLQDQVSRRIVGFGINHEMRDFRTARKKNLDLVLCTPGAAGMDRRFTFAELVDEYELELSAVERKDLLTLPPLSRVDVGSVHVALEAKACMTAHIKALPRLYDEMNSSHGAIHGSADFAIAAGFAMVNFSDSFISPGLNTWRIGRRKAIVSQLRQPDDTIRTIEKLKEIPRRAAQNTDGFDALGIVIVRMANDGTPVEIVGREPAPNSGDPWHYDQMIRRIASLYATKFGNL
jgi:hypothetical protein